MATGSITQTFSGTQIFADLETISNVLTVSGVPANATITSIQVQALDITHRVDQDLDISLVDPDGNQIDLSSDNGGNARGYSGITFSDSAGSSITGATATGSNPITGTYTPEQSFSSLFSGAINGSWTLKVTDDTTQNNVSNGSGGTLTGWTLVINYTYDAAPTAVTLSNTVTSTAENGVALKVANISVTDDDLGTNDLGLTGADAASFEIRDNGGQKELWFKGGANYEGQSTYDVNVTVDDAGVGGSPDASQSFSLSVGDLNEAPTAVSFTNTVTSTAENGGEVKVADITISDDALGTNDLALTGADAAAFEIRDNGGQKELWFKGGADYEAQSSYDVSVTVDDAGVGASPDASQSFSLTITDENEAPAGLTLLNAVSSVDENGTDVKVADISVSDDALGTNSLALTGTDAASFEIRDNGGQKELWFKGSANYESQATYDVNVTVDDGSVGSSPDASQSFSLSINDVNEAPGPVSLTNTVSSTAENGGELKVADISVGDDALGTNGLALTGADAASFEIRDNGGQKELWFKGGANYESQSTYDVNVTVDDTGVGGTPDASQSFSLSITDVNEAPTAVSFTNTVTSTAENGGELKVADISVSDDALGTNSLALTGTDAASFEIRDNGGQMELWFKGGANYEGQSTYDVSVTADDGSVGTSPDAGQSFSLTITDANESPSSVSFTNTVTSTAENDGELKVADISVSDDALGTNSLALTGTDAASFEIRDNGGQKELWFKGGANYESQSTYDVSVTVDDAGVGGSPDASQSFSLSITDVNEAPTAVSFTNTVTSTAENGGEVKVADISVSDDALGTNSLALTGTDAASFEIRDNGGQKELWFKGGADYESQSSYDVTVTVDDAGVGGSPDASQSFSLTITDVDDTAPVAPTLSLQTDTGASSSDGVTSDGTIVVSGLEANATWEYSTDSGKSWLAGSGSTISLSGDGAQSVLARQTDAAGNTSDPSSGLSFTLDTAGPTGLGFVLDTSSGFETSSGLTVGTVVGTVTGRGDNGSGALSYFFATDSKGSGASQSANGLAIDAATGQVSIAGSVGSSPIWVVASDAAGNFFSREISVQVGGVGRDTMTGASGSVAVIGLEGADSLTGSATADLILGGAGSDTISGDAGDDQLFGGSGADLIDGGIGRDTMTGGLGSDTYVLSSAFDTVVETGTNVDWVQSSDINLQLSRYAGIEGARLTGSANLNAGGTAGDDQLVGNTGANQLNGGAGNDALDGQAGADTMTGGSGNDLYTVDSASDRINETASGGTDGIRSSTMDVDLTKYAYIENVSIFGTSNLNITGNGGANVLLGNSGDNLVLGGGGNDWINGRGGNDTLSGGAGSDTYVFSGTIGHSVISGFGDKAGNQDVIRFAKDIYTNYAAVQADMHQIGADVVIGDVGGAHSITIRSVKIASLDASDFDFI